jgi:anti-anti-sigma regulatory factor
MSASEGDVILDLAGVTFVDSSGVGAIVRLAGALGDRTLAVTGAKGTVRSTLLISGIDGLHGIRIAAG